MYKYKFLQVGQLPLEHLSFLQNPLSFFKAPVASIIGDIEIYQCHIKMALLSPVEKCPVTSITELLLLPNFDDSSPSVTRDKEICHMIMS